MNLELIKEFYTDHFVNRMERMLDIGLTKNEIIEILEKAKKVLTDNPEKENSAILVKSYYNRQYCYDGTSGDEAWIITQKSKLHTIMLRPRNRPKKLNYFKNVDYIFNLV